MRSLRAINARYCARLRRAALSVPLAIGLLPSV
jgi:hypothetical protein